LEKTKINTDMKQIKCIIVSFFAITCVVLSGSVFASCSSNDDLLLTDDSQTEQVSAFDQDATNIIATSHDFREFGIPSYPAGTITLSDFANQKNFFTKEELNDKLKDGYLGNTAENALVVLLFNKKDVLVTPYEFNYSLRGKIDLEKEGYRTFFTDLKTFYSITRLEQAKGIYARCASGIWIFDHLSKFYLTEKDIEEKLNAKEYEMFLLYKNLRTSVQDYFVKGNMLSGKFGFTGKLTPHIAGITSNLSASYGTVNTALSYLYVTEALPPGEANSVIKHIATDTSTDGDWAKSSTYERKVLFPKPLLGLSSSTMNQISSYIDSQIGKPYDFEGKLILDSFYCSKLVWIAYYLKANVDIDTDGGYWVWPNDIIIDDDIAYLSF